MTERMTETTYTLTLMRKADKRKKQAEDTPMRSQRVTQKGLAAICLESCGGGFTRMSTAQAMQMQSTLLRGEHVPGPVPSLYYKLEKEA